MAQRLGNISKSSFRFIREGSLYIYFGIALLGAVYLAYLSFTYDSTIQDDRLDLRSELIAKSNIDEAGSVPSRARPDNQSQNLDPDSGANSSIIPVASTDAQDEQPTPSATENTVDAIPLQQKSTIAKDIPSKQAIDNQRRSQNQARRPAPRNRRYQWVLKSFNNPEFANNWVQKFKDMGLGTNVVRVNYDGNTWYRVTHGDYPSVAAAKVVQNTLPNIGDEDYWISPIN